MSKNFRLLPVGNLPYTTEKATTKIIVKLFEDNPFLACLPCISKNDNILHRSICNIPAFVKNEKKIIFNISSSECKKKLEKLDLAYKNPTIENLQPFEIEASFLSQYFRIIDRIKPSNTVINLLGAFSISQMLTNVENDEILLNKDFRKIVIQTLTVKALYIINKIKALSPETCPIIMFDEPLLYKLSTIKRMNENLSNESIINLFEKIFSKIHAYGGKVGIQCFEKCNWSIPIKAGIDIISFDAYNNPNCLNIIPEQINEFLINGGRINWGIVPVMNETVIKNLNFGEIFDRFIKTIYGLIDSGVSERFAFARAMISIQGDVDKLPLIFAEKALIIASQISKKIPIKK